MRELLNEWFYPYLVELKPLHVFLKGFFRYRFILT